MDQPDRLIGCGSPLQEIKLSSRRVLKAAQAIREVVSMAILTDMKDPRIKDVTVTFVEVSNDLRHAKVHVSVMGDEKKKSLCLKGLQHATGFLQQRVGSRIDTRYTPRVMWMATPVSMGWKIRQTKRKKNRLNRMSARRPWPT